MLIVIPYAPGGLRPETVEAACVGHTYEVLVTPVHGDQGYWQLLRDLWHDGEEIINIEQDIVIHPDVIPTMAACGHRWCGYTYAFGLEAPCAEPFMGCTHFSAELMAEQPDAMERIRERHWHKLDQFVKRSLGLEQAVHVPSVAHLHEYA